MRKRTFELRIEQRPKITRQLGHGPDVRVGEARRAAEDIWAKHKLGEPLDGGAKKGGETIASTWPLFKVRLKDDGRSERTIDGYQDVFDRLGDDTKQQPLMELGVEGLRPAAEPGHAALSLARPGGRAAALSNAC